MRLIAWPSFLAVLRKEFIHIRRDRISMFIILGMPVALLLFFGYSVNSEINKISTVVWDQTESPDSRSVVQALKNSTYFIPVGDVSSYEEIQRAMVRGQTKAAIVIPEDFGRKLRGGGESAIQFIVDGSDWMTSRAALPAVQAVIGNQAQVLHQEIKPSAEGNTGLPGIRLESRVWYNPDLTSIVNNIPNLIALIIQNVIIMLTAFSMVREKERGTIEQLIVTPLRSFELILGKLLPYIAIGFFSFLSVLAVGIFWFGVMPQGSVLLLLLLGMFYLIALLATGLLISSLAKTQLQAMQLTFAMILPSVLVTGFTYPRSTMPEVLYWISNLFPMTHFMIIARGIFLKSAGLVDLWPQATILILYSCLVLWWVVMRFKKTLD